MLSIFLIASGVLFWTAIIVGVIIEDMQNSISDDEDDDDDYIFRP